MNILKTVSLIIIALAIGCSNRPVDKIVPSASLPKTTPWDLEALSKAPSVKWLSQKGKIHSLIYQGLPYKGKPTSVFAFYATPGSISGDPAKDKGLPAIVLVHGGGAPGGVCGVG